ncbi:MAG: DUF2490 domain-containing protein [Crocinitomicaceae bacterium]
MKAILVYPFLCLLFLAPKISKAQINQGQIGAWYMYFFNTNLKQSPWGLQGDIQYRNWNIVGDLEQLLLRGGVTYSPKNADVKFTLGYGNVTTGAFGSSQSTSSESRVYQEALYPVKFGDRFYTNHRFRFEQRFVEGQDLRPRYRYNLFLNIPLNNKNMAKGTVYLAMYNELFINGQRHVGNGNTVEIFDRNRFYVSLGYILKNGLKMQMGVMNQTTDNWHKTQLQFSFHQKI